MSCNGGAVFMLVAGGGKERTSGIGTYRIPQINYSGAEHMGQWGRSAERNGRTK